MDTKHIHCMLEDMAEYGKEMISCATGSGNVNLDDAGKIIDIVKDLADAEYHALIAKEMRKANEDEEAEEKYMKMKMKEEHADEYKRYMDEYGEDGERRFYDNYRYKSSGRFAPKGRGSYMPRGGRRGYEEPMYFLPPEVYMNYSPEELRDMDRDMGRMYYGGGSSGGSGGSSGQSGSSGMSGGNSGGNVRGYEDGYNDGNRRGYSEGYKQGSRDGRSQGGNSRYENARRSYSESKQKNRGNTPEENSENMKKLEEVLNTVKDNIQEYVPMMSTSEKAMAKQKIDGICKMIQQ